MRQCLSPSNSSVFDHLIFFLEMAKAVLRPIIKVSVLSRRHGCSDSSAAKSRIGHGPDPTLRSFGNIHGRRDSDCRLDCSNSMGIWPPPTSCASGQSCVYNHLGSLATA